MVIMLSGPSGSGKTTVENHMISKGFKNFQSYTTRAKREEDKSNYHFMSHDEFFELLKEGFFDEYIGYQSKDNVIDMYGMKIPEDVDRNNYIVVVTPVGKAIFIEQLKKKDIPFTSVYINISKDTVKKRMTDRGDNIDSVEYKLQDFKWMSDQGYDLSIDSDKLINSVGSDDIAELIAQDIINFINSDIGL